MGPGPILTAVSNYAWRLGAIALAIFGVILVGTRITVLLLGLFFALLIASWLMPLVDKLSGRMKRGFAVLIALVGFALLVAAVFGLVVVSIGSDWRELYTQAKAGIAQFETWLQGPPLNWDLAQVNTLVSNVESFLRERTLGIFKRLGGEAGAFFGVFTALLASVFVLLFLLLQPAKLFAWFMSWISPRAKVKVGTSIRIGWRAFKEYSIGIVFVALSDALVVGIALALMGIPLAAPLAVLVFFGAFIPVVGAPIAMLIAVFVALATKGPLYALLVLGLIVLVGQLEGHIFQPLILGKALSTHPLTILLTVAIGTAYAGIIGALIAVPIVITIYDIAKYLTNRESFEGKVTVYKPPS
ncbi:MAG: AI-2E family transporter [Actinobacteria bacterium]|nr:AI-2E family transporter [Actinomycetota bacterium]